MRKSFTRFLSIVMLLSITLLSAVAFGASPTISKSVPIDGFSNYNGASGKLTATLTFDQAVVPGAAHAGIIGLYIGGQQVDPIQISGATSTNPLTGSTVVISNNTVTITFNRTMAQGETYFITVSPDALMNASGQYFAGLSNSNYDVTIGDFTKPTIDVVAGKLALTPKDDSFGFPASKLLADELLIADFSENIAFGSGNIALYKEDGNVVELFELATDIDLVTPANPAPGKVGISGDKLYIRPTAALSELQKYYVRIAATAITDVAPVNLNPFDGINNNTTWSFQAADKTAPSLAFVPVNAKTDVQQNQVMKITFTDNRTGAGLPFEVRKSNGTKFAIGDDVSSLCVFTENGGAPVGTGTIKYTGVNEITFAWGTGVNDKFIDHANYVFGIKPGSFFDEEGNNALAPVTSAFTTGDFIAPVMSTVAVAAGSTAAPNNVAADLELAKLFLQSTNTDASGNDVEVHYLIVANGAAAPTPAQVMAGPALTNVTGSTNIARAFATVDGAGAALASKTKYDVYFAAKDHATVPNTSTQAEVTASVKTVETSDIVAPVPTAKLNTLTTTGLTLTSGAASVSNVKLNSDVTITFDETVVAATANITVKYYNTALATPAWQTLTDGTDYTFAFAANTITITGKHAGIVAYPTALWKSQGQYQVIIDNNEIKDVITGTGTANPIAQKVYAFTVEDYTGPVAVFNGTSSNNITGVATTANIVIDLGEACTRADGTTAIDNNNVFFRDVATGNIVPSTVTVSGGRYITIDPTATLLDGNTGHNYSVELTASIIDAAGNPLGYYKGGAVTIGSATPQILTFTTADEQKPALSFNPADGTTGLNNNNNGMKINVSINETVKKANGDVLTASDANYLRSIVSVVKVSDNSPINFDITTTTATTFDVDLTNFLSAYAASESYKVTVNGLFDAAGNPITANSTTFSIREYTKPTITAYSPTDGSTLVAAAAPIKITFSEPVIGVAGQLITLTRDDVAGSWTFDASTGTTIASNVVTLNPAAAVPVGATPAFAGFAELGAYHVTFAAGAFQDLVGNLTANAITTATAWNWSAFDATKPTLFALTPADDATPAVTTVAKPSTLKMVFTEASGKVFAGPGSIYVREVGNTGIPDFTIPAQSSAVSITNNTVTIAVNAATFKYNTDYWVEVDANAFRDASDNYYAGLVNNSALWNFKIEADPKPYYVIAQSTPLDDANDVDLNAAVTIKFSEPVWITNPVGKYLTFRNAADGTAHHTVYFDSPSVTWSWNLAHDALTVQHPDFLADKSYYINITTGTFTDAAGQAIDPTETTAPKVGDLDNTSKLNFTTSDLTAPVVSTITVNGTDVKSSLTTTPTGIAKDGKIVVTFSEPVAIATPGSAIMLNAGAITYTATFASNTLTITPSAALASGITVTVDVVANQIFDLSTAVAGGNALAAGTVGKFTVLDYVNPNWDATPVVANVTPGNNSFAVANISIDEAGKIYYYAVPKGTFTSTPSAASVKQNATGSATVTAATTTLSITGLLGDTSYDLYFIAQDNVPNLMDGTTAGQQVVSVLNVKTSDNVAPQLLTSFNTAPFTAGLAPANGAGCVATATTLKLKFNENIGTVDASKFWVRKVSDDHSVGTPLTVSASGDVVTITLAAALAEVTNYYVEINPKAIQDVAGNYWGDYFYGNARWNFTTADETHPSITALTKLSPNGGASAVAVAAGTLTMEFSEPVVKNTTSNVFIDIYRAGTTSPQERINVLSDAVQVSGKTVTITRSNIFASETSYYVLVPNNAFYDLACTPNNFAGYALATDWTFTTTDITAPVVEWTPANNAVQQPTSTPIIVKFIDPRQSEITGSTKYETLYKSGTEIANGTDLKTYFTATKNGGPVTVSSAIYSNPTAAPGDEFVIVVLNGSATLDANSTYVINYNQSSVITDEKTANVVASSTVTFATQDTKSPVITFAPAHNATNVKVTDYVTIKFNKKIYNFNDGLAGINHINFTPSATDLLDPAYVTFKDLTVAGNVAYTVTVVEPGVEYRLVPVAALASSHKFEVVWNANAATNPAGQLVYDMLYLNNNILNVTSAYATTGGDKIQFTAEDVVGPKVTALSPVNNTWGTVNPTSALTLTFDETVKAGTGNIQIRRGNGQIFAEVAAADCDYSVAKNVTIPHVPFEKFTTYYVIIPDGTITDASSNANKSNAVYTNNTQWTFSTGDGTAPYVTGYSPANGSVNIPVYSNLTLQFSENVAVNAGKNLVIYYNNGDPGNDGNAIEIIPLTSANPKVVISGSNIAQNLLSDIITVDPATNFNKLGTYYIRIDNGAVSDGSSNNYAGINNNTTWAFTITDNTTPALVGTTPLNNATGIGTTPVLTMNFDRDVLAGTGNIKVFEYYYNPATFAYEEKLVESMPVTSSQVVVSGSTVTVTPTAKLGDNKVYYVLVDNTAITNTASSKDLFAGISNPFSWRFTTGDNTAPSVIANPATGTNMTNTFDVTLTFNETVSGVSATSVTTTGGTVVLSTVTAGTVYKATITADDLTTVVLSLSSAIKDANNNALVPVSFTYKTGDFNGPKATVTPGTATNLAKVFTVNVKFNEAVTGAEAGITATGGAAVVTKVSDTEYNATITAAADNSTVTLALANTIKDAAGNAFAGATYSYKTGDNTAPAIITVNPNGGATLNAHPANFEMYLSEAVVKGTGKLTVYKKAGDVKFMELDASTATITAAGTTYKVTIPLTGSLDRFTEYYVLVSEGFVADANANKLAAVTDKAFWTFKTGDWATDVNPIGSLEFKVYPNPFVDYVTVENASELSKVVVTNIAGQIVKEVVNPTDRIQLNELRSGVYFISLYGMDNVVAKTAKIVKR